MVIESVPENRNFGVSENALPARRRIALHALTGVDGDNFLITAQPKMAEMAATVWFAVMAAPILPINERTSARVTDRASRLDQCGRTFVRIK